MKIAMSALVILAFGILTFTLIAGPQESRAFEKLVAETIQEDCQLEYPPSFGETKPAELSDCEVAAFKKAHNEFWGTEIE